MTDDVPNPGSAEALNLGCRCPVLDNAHGRGYMSVPGVFVTTEGCPLHWPHDISLKDDESP